MIFGRKKLVDIPGEGPYRKQGPKPPKPKLPWKLRYGWLRVILFGSRDWSLDIFDLRFPFFLPCLIGVALTVAAAIGVPIYLTSMHFSPCATDEVVKGTKAAVAPDGTPAQIATSWCKQYKPGREGEKP